MTWTNYEDVRGQLIAAGLILNDALVADTHKIQRVKVEGSNEKRGWYKLFSLGDLLTGAYGIWSADNPQSFKVDLPKSDRKKLTADELAVIKAKQAADAKRAEAERARETERAAQQAAAWWRQLQDAGHSGYMAKKGFDGSELFGARVSKAGNLVVPVQDGTGKIYGLQVIYPSKSAGPRQGRDKDFTPPGLAKKAHFFQIGLVQRGGVVLLCEGFATGASLRKATGLPVVVAFDAGNLTPVALEIHKAHRKDIRILVCADDDYLTDAKTGRNPGREAAALAANGVEGAVVWPQFPGERPTDTKGPTDFNDLHCHPDGGLQAVRAQVEVALATAGWVVKPRASGAESRPMGSGAGGSENSRRRAEAIMLLDDIVERFIPLDDGSGDHVWDDWTRKIVKQRQMITLLPAKVRNDDIKQHPIWRERGAYFLHEVGFDPTGKDASVRLNAWRGWPTQPRKGKCELLLELLRFQCSKEPEMADELYAWVEKYLAYIIQHPGAKMQTAIIMHGPQGTGKGRFFEWGYMPIFGEYGVYLDQDALEDKHGSDWQSCKLFVLADEVLARQEMFHHKNKLKNLVTSRRIRINPKGLVAFEETNHLNVVFLSNEKQPLVLENDDRRYCVIWTPPPLTRDFYDELSEEIANGGAEALHHYLKHEVDLGDFKPWTTPPVTEAKRDLINMSRDSVDRFMIDWRNGDLDLPFCPCSSADLYRAYLYWCRINGERMPRPENQFSGHVVKLHGWYKGHKDVNMEDSDGHMRPMRQRVIIPSEADLNESAKRGGIDYRQSAGESMLKWVTTCFYTFRAAMKDAQ
jgi:putative DNA primase/helicase